MSDLLKEKRERIAKTIRREEVDKPSFMMIADDYVPYYVGVERSEVTSWDKAAEVMGRFAEDVQYDTHAFPYMPANLFHTPKLEVLGGGTFMVRDFLKMQNPKEVKILEPEEYPELIKSPAEYLLTKVYPRRLKLLGDISPEEKYNRYMRLLDETQKFAAYVQNCEARGSHEIAANVMLAPVDLIFDNLREFSGIISDVKRRPELLRDAGLAIFEEFKALIDATPLAEDKAIFFPLHIPAFLSPKDFEKVYWPSFKLLTEYLVEKGHNVLYYFEKNYSHLHDFLQELPKKGIIGIFQEDDLRVVKKKLGGTMAIAGGLSTAILKNGTKEQCLEHVKGLIDDLCPGGGYFIAPTTPMMFPVDGRQENLKAVADYIRDYSL